MCTQRPSCLRVDGLKWPTAATNHKSTKVVCTDDIHDIVCYAYGIAVCSVCAAYNGKCTVFPR